MIFLLAFLLLQFGPQDDLMRLRRFLGTSYRSAIQILDEKNQLLIRNTERLAPQQAAEMRVRMQPPPMPDGVRPMLALTVTGIGQGFVTDLFEEDFLTEQVNLIFCREPERVISVQVLLDDRQALGTTADLLQKIYGLPAPVSFQQYRPAMRYGLSGVRYDEQGEWEVQGGAAPVTVWDLGMVEVVYQPVMGQSLVTGQLWITDKANTLDCPES